MGVITQFLMSKLVKARYHNKKSCELFGLLQKPLDLESILTNLAQ